MKLTLTQLSGHLTQQLAPIYVLASPEPLLLQEGIGLIRAKAQQAGFTERHWFSPTQQEEWQQLTLLQNNLDLFSQKQIIEIFLSNGKLGKQGSQQLQQYAKQIKNYAQTSNQILIISSDKLDKTLINSSWVTACAEQGVFIPIWPLSATEFSAWLKRQTQLHQVELTPDAFSELVKRTQGNLLAAHAALQQLSQFTQTIDIKQLQELITHQAQYAIMDYVQQITSGQSAQSLQTLNRLQEHDVEPTWIIWQLAQHLRKLIQNNSRGNWETVLQKVGELEMTVKSFTTDSWTALRHFTYEIVKQQMPSRHIPVIPSAAEGSPS